MRKFHRVLMKLFKTLPATRQNPVLAEFDRLRYLPSAERQQRMAGEEFLNSYSGGEIVLLRELMEATSRKAP